MSAIPPLTITAANMVVMPGPVPLSIGAVTFSHEECPEQFPLGAAEQMTVTHNLPGGGIITNTFGNKPKPVSFSGRFFAGNIAPRVQQLRLYQVSGQVVPVLWGSESYSAIVREFTPGYRNGYNEYTLTLEIVAANNGAFAVATPNSIDQQVAALQAQATSQNAAIIGADPTGSTAFQASLTAVFEAILAAIPLAQLAAEDGPNILSLIGSAIAALELYQGVIGQSAPQYANTIALLAALNAIAGNVAQGQPPQTITVLGGDLFGIAAQYYGDPSLAFALQAANDLASPFLSDGEPTTITLPPLVGAAA